MAPSPEHENEPKAPDKSDNNSTTTTTPGTTTGAVPENVAVSTESKPNSIIAAKDDLQESSVSTLDDCQLKALLDEAINYKTPKDKVGKSLLFQELLQEAEEDERNARAASASGSQLARYYNTTATRRHRNSISRRETSSTTSASACLTHGGSLQNLAKPELYTDNHATGRRAPGSNRRRHAATVSARQREGGSLPSNVNVGGVATYDHRQLLTVDDTNAKSNRNRKKILMEVTTETPVITQTIKPEYTVVELGHDDDDDDDDNDNDDNEERRSLLGHDFHAISYNSTMNFEARNELFSPNGGGGGEQDECPEKSTHRIPRPRYTSRATLEVDGVSDNNNHLGTTVKPASIVDKAIIFPQLQRSEYESGGGGGAALQLATEYESVRSIVDGGGGGNDTAQFHRQQITQSYPLTTISSTWCRVSNMANPKSGIDRFQSHPDKKYLDENGNSVNNTTSSSSSSHLDAKRKKKCKVDRKVTVLNSEQIDGYRGNTNNIDQLVKYIEEGDGNNSTKQPKHHVNLKNNNQPQPSNNNNNNNNNKRTRIKSKSDVDVVTTVKKSNSLEEISRSKLEDLVTTTTEDLAKCVRNRVKKQSTSEDGDRRSWGTEDGQQYIVQSIPKQQHLEQAQPPPETVTIIENAAEFRVVTKKKKSKKRIGRHENDVKLGTSVSNNRNDYYNHHSRAYYRGGKEAVSSRRRKSACSVPPSDKSNDDDDDEDCDSSDVDSVHSLPVGSVHGRRAEAGTINATTQSQQVPAVISYADITKTTGLIISASGFGIVSNNNGNGNGGITGQNQISGSSSSSSPPVTLRSEHFPDLCDKLPENPIPTERNVPTVDNNNTSAIISSVVVVGDGTIPILTISQSAPVKCKQSSIVVTPNNNNNNNNNNIKITTETDFKCCDNISGVLNMKTNDGGARAPRRTIRRSRPAVIILDAISDFDMDSGGGISNRKGPIQVSGLTFGFELNEQLLNNNCTAATQLSDGDEDVDADGGDDNNNNNNNSGGVVVVGVGSSDKCSVVSDLVIDTPTYNTQQMDIFSARFLPPNITSAYNHDKIVTFVGLAWEDVMHQPSGKVQYYNGQ